MWMCLYKLTKNCVLVSVKLPLFYRKSSLPICCRPVGVQFLLRSMSRIRKVFLIEIYLVVRSSFCVLICRSSNIVFPVRSTWTQIDSIIVGCYWKIFVIVLVSWLRTFFLNNLTYSNFNLWRRNVSRDSILTFLFGI